MVDKLIDKSDVNGILQRVVFPEHIEEWWDTPMNKLDGSSPNQVWETGKREIILRLVLDYLRPLAYS